ALGIVMENNAPNYEPLRFGFEANTSNTPVVAFIGGKWFLSNVDSKYPMFMSAGLIGNFGNNSNVGVFISLIFQRFLDIKPLFLEVGVDAMNSGSVQVQAGYYF
ncbi:MAG: hypothetical protein PHV30_07230, partial [Candidatus Margulisbacteria bacterium]|nr:hypothetical protein [Candidatus Margulisiibacteriota bacterium]